MKPNYWTIAAILLIFFIALWSYLNTGSLVSAEVDKCRSHFKAQIERFCPAASNESTIYRLAQLNFTTSSGS